ncbi:hypothetical protein MR626_04910 [bacterium]|nr:hypothetical protein [bacterium]
MENQQENGFSYTYSAREQEEVRRIREKYSPKSSDKMAQLRKLDQSVTQKATYAAILAGVCGCLILGLGMSCVLVWSEAWFVPGVLIGLVGIALIGAAYPLFHFVTKKEREKIAPEIIRLTDELMK